jgi:hypothetical protein
VIETPTFSRQKMFEALIYAEEKLNAAFYPFPDLDIAWRQPGCRRGAGCDVAVRIGGQRAIANTRFSWRPP